MKKITLVLFSLLALTLNAQILSESFDDIAVLTDWDAVNVSEGIGSSTWFQGNGDAFPSQTGAPTAYIGANFNSTIGATTISNWLILPVLTLSDADVVTFWTRTTTGSTFPDRLEVRISDAGASSVDPVDEFDVGSYTNLQLSVNPNLLPGGYPDVWELQTINISGLGDVVDARIAFRYFVTDGGPSGSNSNYIGIDEVQVVSVLSVEEFEISQIDHHFNQDTKILTLESQNVLSSVSIYNILGQETLKVNFNNTYSEVNLSNLQAGIYIAKIIGDNNATKTIKLVVK